MGHSSGESGRPLRAVVLCALKVERLAMRRHLTDLRDETHESGLRFATGRLNGGTCEVVLVEAGRGNVRAGAITQQSIGLFSPDVLLCVGVAGALRGEVELGDVVVATQVYAYQGGTATKDFLARPQAWPAPYGLEQTARSVDDSDDWRPRAGDKAGGPETRVHFRPIAAGDVVLDGRDSAVFAHLRAHYNDAAAIDMEDAGVAQVAHLNNVPALAIRGISDRADGHKADADRAGGKQRAAGAAAAFAAALLARHDPVTRVADMPPAAITPSGGQRSGAGTAKPGPRRPQHAYVQEKTAGFVGRDSVFADFAAFLAAHPSGHILVEGMPGVGKTSLLAEEVRRNSWPAHFNIAAQGVNGVMTFMRTMHDQLAERYRVRLTLPGADDDRNGLYLSSLLAETADRLAPGEKLVIVVDALDEVSVGHAGVNALFLPTVLPAGLYLLLSRRSRTAPLQVDGPSVVVDLMARKAESRKDVAQFIRNSLARPEMAARLSGVADQEPVVASLLDSSELNFMYLVYVLRDIEAGRMPPGDLSALPQGLAGYYARHLERMLAKGASAVPSLRMIYALAAIREPVPASLLASVVRVTELEAITLLSDWAQFLVIEPRDGRSAYGLYHQSFCDFLMDNDTVRAAGVDLGAINSTVGRGLVNRLGLDLGE